MVSVWIDKVVATRGPSGTARGIELLERAVEASPRLTVANPGPPSPRRRGMAGILVHDFGVAPLRSARADVALFPANVGVCRPGVASILVVHDTMTFDLPASFDPKLVWNLRATVPPSLRLARVVMTPSASSARRIRARWPWAPPVEVVPWAATEVSTTRPRRRPATPLVVMVGSTMHHKRHVMGIRAVAHVRHMTGVDVRLALIGQASAAEPEVRACLADVDARGRWTERIDSATDADVEAYYERAWVLLQPSQMEGFGLPILEAAARGLPSVHSGAGGLREIDPEATVHPADPISFAHALVGLLDPVAYEQASTRVLGVGERFTFARFARGVDRVVDRALDPAGSTRHWSPEPSCADLHQEVER